MSFTAEERDAAIEKAQKAVDKAREGYEGSRERFNAHVESYGRALYRLRVAQLMPTTADVEIPLPTPCVHDKPDAPKGVQLIVPDAPPATDVEGAISAAMGELASPPPVEHLGAELASDARGVPYSGQIAMRAMPDDALAELAADTSRSPDVRAFATGELDRRAAESGAKYRPGPEQVAAISTATGVPAAALESALPPAPPANPFAAIAAAVPPNPFATAAPSPTLDQRAEEASRAALARTAEEERAHALAGLPAEKRERVAAALAGAAPELPTNPFAAFLQSQETTP